MGSGATILLKVHFDFLVPLGIALSTGSICREDEIYSAAVSHLRFDLVFSFNAGCAAASSVRTIAAGRQPLLDPAHIDPVTASDGNRRNLACPNQVKTEPVRQTRGLREFRYGYQLGHHLLRTRRCSRTSGWAMFTSSSPRSEERRVG